MRTIMDPREVHQFALDLEQRSKDLMNINAGVASASIAVHDSWRDAKYIAFQRLVDEATLEIKRFCEYADRYANHLNKKASGVDRYLENP